LKRRRRFKIDGANEAPDKIAGFCAGFRVTQDTPNKNMGTRFDMKIMMVSVCLLLGVWTTSAGAIDLVEFAPCKAAALRFCEHSGAMTWSNLVRCGATLAAHSWRVGSSCRQVLHKYGQL